MRPKRLIQRSTNSSIKKVIAGFESPARYLPSLEAQHARQASLPAAADLKGNLVKALNGLPIQADRLDPFLQDVDAARNQPLLTRKELEGTLLGHRRRRAAPERRYSLERACCRCACQRLLRSILAVCILQSRNLLSGRGVEAVVLDVKGEIDRLYSSYLSEVVRLSLAGFAGIVVLLLIFLRSPTRTAARRHATRAGSADGNRMPGIVGTTAHDPAPDRHAVDHRGRIQLRTVLRPPLERSARRLRTADSGLPRRRQRGNRPRIRRCWGFQRCRCWLRWDRLSRPAHFWRSYSRLCSRATTPVEPLPNRRRPEHMRTLCEPAQAGVNASTRVLFLPAAYTGPEDFIQAGFVSAVRERGVAARPGVRGRQAPTPD